MLVLISGIALTMSPMTAAIMSAVPPRRAGAGSAMNDTTRELGAALGVAVLGSVAASRYSAGIADAISGLPAADQAAAGASLGGALQTAARLPQAIGAELASAAEHAFVSGIHFAAITGAVLAAGAALMVLKFLPRHIVQQGRCTTPCRPPKTWPSSVSAVRCRCSRTRRSATTMSSRLRPKRSAEDFL